MSDKYFIAGKWYRSYVCGVCKGFLHNDYLISLYNPCPHCGEPNFDLFDHRVEKVIVRKKYKSFLHWIFRRYELEEK